MSTSLKPDQPQALAGSAQNAIQFELDGCAVEAHVGESILQAAERHGVAIPRLCFTDGLRADGNCRACVVEIEGERVLAPSCCRAVQPGMKVRATSERARKSQDMVLELLMAEMPEAGFKWNDADPHPSPLPPGGGGGNTDASLIPTTSPADSLPLPLPGEGWGEGGACRSTLIRLRHLLPQAGEGNIKSHTPT